MKQYFSASMENDFTYSMAEADKKQTKHMSMQGIRVFQHKWKFIMNT